MSWSLGPIFPKRHAEPPRRLYLHLGLHKTGTTSLQYLLHDRMQVLCERGYLYPGTGRHPRAHVQHAIVSRAMRPREEVRQSAFGLAGDVNSKIVIRALLHEIDLSGCKNVILSSEEFATMQDASIRRFFDTFRHFDVVPILYTRNFVQLSGALYQTFITHTPLTVDFGEFAWDKQIRTDLHNICANWSVGAYRRQIVLRNYDRENFNVIDDFIDIIGLTLADVPASQRTQRFNTTLPAAAVIILRELKKGKFSSAQLKRLQEKLTETDFERVETFVTKLDEILRDGYSEKYNNYLVSNLLRLRFKSPHSLVPPSLQLDLHKKYQDEIKAIDRSKLAGSEELVAEILSKPHECVLYIESVEDAMALM
jgi:hypothetical protein